VRYRGTVELSHLIRSLEALGAPQHILAALDLLQFDNSSAVRLLSLDHAERNRFLKWCDDRQLTLMLPDVCGFPLPDWFTRRVRAKARRYEARFKRLKAELFQIVEAFNAAGLEFVLLKGISHAPAFTPDARLRAQGDIDLWLIGASVLKGQDILRTLGYVPLLHSKSRHLPPMGRPSDWRWRGDLFDPEMPISVELHYDLWSEQAEHIAIPGLEHFWNRKELRDFDGYKIHVLSDADLLGFASLHLLLHLLHGDLPLQRAWEIARFLETHVRDDHFWTSWRTSHPPALRQLETAVFYLVTSWFACQIRQELRADVQELPTAVKLWLEEFSSAPLAREWAPNKAEIWLHLALIQKRSQKFRVLLRRLLPTTLPCFADRAISHESLPAKLLKCGRQVRLLTSRLSRHGVTFAPTMFDGLRWFLRLSGSCRPHKDRFAAEDPTSNRQCSAHLGQRASPQDASPRRSGAHYIQ
jgi:hypothetical protein